VKRTSARSPKRTTQNGRGAEAEAPPKPSARAAPKPSARAAPKPNEPRAALEATGDQPTPEDGFPVVGIGASAGGLEALVHFLKNVPAKTGMAFVVVQHLDPTRKGMLVELLQRDSLIPVVQIADGMPIGIDHVYVLPPNTDLAIRRGIFHLLEPAAPRGLRLPIDFFFRSLAAERGEQSVGVILSGMGSDGTLGLRAIRERAGATFVQEPTDAKFDGMPRSAIDAGFADVVALASELPAHIAAFRKHPHGWSRTDAGPVDAASASALEKIIAVLLEQTGQDFSRYKVSTLHRRVQRRMTLHQLDSMLRYVHYLRENPRESDLLFKELLIGVTSFFRDPAAWTYLEDVAIPSLLAARPRTAVLRAWVPACSTGEEAYSLAMAFVEALEALPLGARPTLHIFATDLDRDAIDKARLASYPEGIVADVSEERLQRFFVESPGGYRVNRQIRDMVVFAVQNVVQDAPFTKLDLLSCRNLLIYLAPEVQQKLIPLFHYCLRPDGILALGTAESIGSFGNLFTLLDRTNRIYRKVEPAVTGRIDFPSSFGRAPGRPTAPSERESQVQDLQPLAEAHLLRRAGHSAVLVGPKGDVLFTSGKTDSYLELPAGKPNWNIFAMARDGLRQPLGLAVQRAFRSKAALVIADVAVSGPDGAHVCDVSIEPFVAPSRLQGTAMIVFSAASSRSSVASTPGKAARPSGHASKVLLLEAELQRALGELRVTSEEFRSTQEELRSANEELQSTNEELQSTNEELTTSKEEMQSMNEELQSLNHELQAKVDDLSNTSDDLKNLLDSTQIAVLFLDRGLRVRRFTPSVTSIIKLIPTDVGRPLADLASELEYVGMYTDAHEVLRTLLFTERTVTSRDRRWFRVRIMPYRTCDDRIDGLVITFTNVTPASDIEPPPSEPGASN